MLAQIWRPDDKLLGQPLNLARRHHYGAVSTTARVVQILIGEKTIRGYAADTPAGRVAMASFGIISSSCSNASAAVARSLCNRGAGECRRVAA